MIHVIASVRVKTGRVNEYLEIFKSNMPKVREEKGCVQYIPTMDIDSGLPPQVLEDNLITIIEKWENMDALHDHLASPHMMAYMEKVEGMVQNVSLKVLKEA
ncbi:MAG: putative quinol monooxygenase [Proteobacteria bacterium]|nr:putative quinol monooxygenase [Pseudomonadota bacterium]